jgi:hypothetical protein
MEAVYLIELGFQQLENQGVVPEQNASPNNYPLD